MKCFGVFARHTTLWDVGLPQEGRNYKLRCDILFDEGRSRLIDTLAFQP
jgi:hypothetical protein